MDLSVPAAVPAARPVRVQAPPAGAGAVLLGTLVTLFGLSWDIQWHIEVGPDTFFTLSHLAIYSGSALSGIASLVMVLLSTAAQRAGRRFPAFAGGTPVKVFGGTFHAPLGYLIAGVGAALFLLYGLLDLWWHSIYGFDAVLNTPSHVALFLSVSITMVGSIVIFAAARDRAWGRAGLYLAVPILIVFGPIAFNGLSELPLPVDPALLGVVLCGPMLTIMGGVLLGRWAAIKIAVVLAVMQLALWWFSPWAAEAYARSVGLPLRDNLQHLAPELPNSIPMFLIAAAAAIEGFLALGRSRPFRFLVPLMGASAGVLVGAGLAVQSSIVRGYGRLSTSEVIDLLMLGLVLGLLAGYLGCRFAVMLRSTTSGDAE